MITMNLSNAAVERIIRNAGADRVSDGAVEELVDAIEDLGAELSTDASELAEYAGRNTVEQDDVELAVNQ